MNPWLPALCSPGCGVATCSHGEESPFGWPCQPPGPHPAKSLPVLRLAEPGQTQAGGPQGWARWLTQSSCRVSPSLGSSWNMALKPPWRPHTELALMPRGAEVVASRCSCTRRSDPSLRLAQGPDFHRGLLPLPQPALRRLASSSVLSPDTPAGECHPALPQWDGGKNHLVLSLHHPLASGSSSWDRRWWPRPAPRWTPSGPALTCPPASPEAHPLARGPLASGAAAQPSLGWP